MKILIRLHVLINHTNRVLIIIYCTNLKKSTSIKLKYGIGHYILV